ncbi:hypothetical protein CA13_40340 [Planctomycetes bacterium CA13]|uniref:GspL periplasmic domain protein n=1 Tax=Novipirellula herctigrandis TaxID=2527986 RepID=A0A5C5Z6Z1_9BACT|nr:hypothetical protein CA13_40340 [Planctomycetes bacterium CA13]
MIIRWSPQGSLLQSIAQPDVTELVKFDCEQGADSIDSIERFTNAVDAFVSQHSINRKQLVVCTGSEITYLVRIARGALDAEPTHDSIRFAIEAVLPLDAEAVEVDFLPRGGTLICAAVETTPLRSFLDALEHRGLEVHHIVPESLLVYQHLIAAQKIPATVQLIRKTQGPGNWLEFLTIANSVPVAWGKCSTNNQAFSQELQMQTELLDIEAPRLWIQSDDAIDKDGESSAVNAVEVERIQVDWNGSLAAASQSLLSHQRQAWFDLRRGTLAEHDPLRAIRSSVRAFVIMFFSAVLVSCAALCWKASQYASRGNGASETIAAVFQETFPNQRASGAVVKRMKSEHIKALGQRTTSGGVEEPIDAIDVLVPLADAFPPDLAMAVRSIRINDGDFVLDLDLGSHEQAGTVSRALEAAGFHTEPPSSVRGSRGRIQTSLRGTFSPSTAPTTEPADGR